MHAPGVVGSSSESDSLQAESVGMGEWASSVAVASEKIEGGGGRANRDGAGRKIPHDVLEALAAEVAEVAHIRPTTAHSSAELLEQITGTASDAPLCMTCGIKMRPAGSCYVCEGCGSTSGCS